MMLDLGSLGSARLWLDEIAESPLETDRWHEDEIPAGERGWFLLDEVSIELLLERPEGRAYGLLGAQFERSHTEGTRLAVRLGEGPDYAESLAAPHGGATFGCSDECAAAALAGAKRAVVARGTTPAGKVAFTVAAASPELSDPALFERLGALAIQLLDMTIEADEEGATAAIQTAVGSWQTA